MGHSKNDRFMVVNTGVLLADLGNCGANHMRGYHKKERLVVMTDSLLVKLVQHA
jgi:hypothetical protein